MVDYSQNEYHRERHPELIESPELRIAWGHFADYRYFQRVRPGHRLLEFGGGLGNNLLSVKNRARVAMTEPSSLGREVATGDGVAAYAGLEDVPPGQFDFILCRHVIEHVENPKDVLESLRRRLTPEGTLILIVPCEPWSMMPDPGDLNHHLYSWNPRTLANLLGDAGYQVTNIRFEYYGARRRLLPVYRWRGGLVYARCVYLVGRVFRMRELVVEARPQPQPANSGSVLF